MRTVAPLPYRPTYDAPLRPRNTHKSGFGVASVVWRELGLDLSAYGDLLEEHLVPVSFSDGCGKSIQLIGVYDEARNDVQLPREVKTVSVDIKGVSYSLPVVRLEDIREGLTLYVVLDNGWLERFTRYDRSRWQHCESPYTHWVGLTSLEWLSGKLIMSINKKG